MNSQSVFVNPSGINITGVDVAEERRDRLLQNRNSQDELTLHDADQVGLYDGVSSIDTRTDAPQFGQSRTIAEYPHIVRRPPSAIPIVEDQPTEYQLHRPSRMRSLTLPSIMRPYSLPTPSTLSTLASLPEYGSSSMSHMHHSQPSDLTPNSDTQNQPLQQSFSQAGEEPDDIQEESDEHQEPPTIRTLRTLSTHLMRSTSSTSRSLLRSRMRSAYARSLRGMRIGRGTAHSSTIPHRSFFAHLRPESRRSMSEIRQQERASFRAGSAEEFTRPSLHIFSRSLAPRRRIRHAFTSMFSRRNEARHVHIISISNSNSNSRDQSIQDDMHTFNQRSSFFRTLRSSMRHILTMGLPPDSPIQINQEYDPYDDHYNLDDFVHPDLRLPQTLTPVDGNTWQPYDGLSSIEFHRSQMAEYQRRLLQEIEDDDSLNYNEGIENETRRALSPFQPSFTPVSLGFETATPDSRNRDYSPDYMRPPFMTPRSHTLRHAGSTIRTPEQRRSSSINSWNRGTNNSRTLAMYPVAEIGAISEEEAAVQNQSSSPRNKDDADNHSLRSLRSPIGRLRNVRTMLGRGKYSPSAASSVGSKSPKNSGIGSAQTTLVDEGKSLIGNSNDNYTPKFNSPLKIPEIRASALDFKHI